MFKKSVKDLGLDALTTGSIKALEIAFKKFGKEMVAKKLDASIPVLNTVYWTSMAIKNVYACWLDW